jgi:hypothetical protein
MKQSSKTAQRNLESSLVGSAFPKCFESKTQYKEWLTQEQIAHTVPFRKNVCEDCTQAFKAQMIEMNRCVNIGFQVKV